MKDFDIYSVEYSAGWGGTWLTWLINQHLDTKIELRLDYDPAQQDFGLGESKTVDGKPLEQSPFHWHHTTESFDQFVERSGHTESFCYKLFPMHNWFEPEGRAMKPHYTKFRFMPYIDQILAKEFILRKIIAINVNDSWRSTRTSENFINDPYRFGKDVASQPLKRLKQNSSNPIHKNIIPIDMGKLLNNDKNEYNKILESIECEPLSDIESHCSMYVEQALHTRNNPL